MLLPFGGEFWAVPKRSDINETRGMLQTYYEIFKGKSVKWENYQQELVARKMHRLGRAPKLLSTKSIRVIKDAAQFFGFVMIKEKKFVITKAGIEFIKSANPFDIFTKQFIKLQLTNPIESRYIKNIHVFPFQVVLRIMLDLGYLTKEEAGLYVFRMKRMNELDKVKLAIKKFRELSEARQQRIINEFTKTAEGRKLLVKAPYVGYAWSFFTQTGLCVKDEEQKLVISPKRKQKVEKILDKYAGIEPVEFRTEEWFDYIGNPEKLYPPQPCRFLIKQRDGTPARDAYVIVRSGNSVLEGFSDHHGVYPFLLDTSSKSDVSIYLPSDYGTPVMNQNNIKFRSEMSFVVATGKILKAYTIDDYITKIKELTEKGCDSELAFKLKILGKRNIITKEELKYIRGARFEQLLYHILDLLKRKGTFDDVVWNGMVSKYGLPRVAPGGKPDIVTYTKNLMYIIEATLLRGRRQWKEPEAASVPDHIEKAIRENKGKDVVGIFVTPQLDRSVSQNLVSRALDNNYKLIPLELETFLDTVQEQMEGAKQFWIRQFNTLWNIHSHMRAR